MKATSWRAIGGGAYRWRNGGRSSRHGSATPTPEAVLNSAIFFDFRPVYGDATLTNRLRAWLLEITQATL